MYPDTMDQTQTHTSKHRAEAFSWKSYFSVLYRQPSGDMSIRRSANPEGVINEPNEIPTHPHSSWED